MSTHRSRFNELGAALVVFFFGRLSHAQACCAGSGVVTPARLALHESALIGAELKAGVIPGSYSASGHYASTPAGVSELDLEQDLFAAARVFERMQLALFIPFVETRRTTRQLYETGGGVGDVNFSARYDLTLAGASRLIPGIGLLAGVTAPTGRPPDAPNLGPLDTGATGIGAWQLSLGLTLEQAFGPWLISTSGFGAQRTARTVRTGTIAVHEKLAPQWTALGATAYVLPSEAAIAVSVSYTSEGDAVIDGSRAAETGHRLTTVTLSGSVPVADSWRLQGAVFDNPPVSALGRNQPADFGAQTVLVHAWR